MTRKTYVIGHKNPDTDSIAAAIAYAELKGLTGETGVIAAMAGSPNPQTSYVLERLGIARPLYLADVYPKVRDVLRSTTVTATTDLPMMQALELFHRNNIRVLPVIDGDGRPVGMVSLLKLSEKYLLTGQDRLRGVNTSLRSLALCLQGTFLSGQETDPPEHLHLFIGAMLEESFSARIEGYDQASLLIVTGDRRTIQQAAVDRGVRLLVVTGGLAVAPEILQQAAARGVAVLSTPVDTATAAWLIRLSTPVGLFAESDFALISADEPLSHLRLKLLHGGEPAVIVVEDDGTLAGVATKSSLLAPIPTSLILVDHNELGQAVPGAEELEIREIIDHHKLGNSHTHHPVTFIAAPVGSTCTLVAALYRQEGLEPSPSMAALLLAGILSDTVILKSPTATARDRDTVLWLEKLAGVDHAAFGRDIFAASSGLATYGSADRIVAADFKHFTCGKKRFGIGQVEVIGFDEFYPLQEKLQEALATVKVREGLVLSGLMVTDIMSETTLFLLEGKKEVAEVMAYPLAGPHLFEMRGVMSRKKQVVPHLLQVLEKLA